MSRLALLMLLAPFAAHAGEPTITPIVTSTQTITGAPILLPEQPEVRATIVEMKPGDTLPKHKHPHQRFAYILSGEVTVEFPDSKKTFVSKAGDFIIEGRDEWHQGVNKGKEPVKLLVIDQVPQGFGPNMVKPN